MQDRNRKEVRKGLIQVYTGDGKGKTTAALGLALRAIGQNMKVIIIQFVKGDKTCGEHLYASTHHDVKIVQLNTQSCFSEDKKQLKLAVGKTLDLAKETIINGNYDIVILDEISVAINLKLIDIGEVMKLLEIKPESMELILTGRNAPDEIIRRADLVTEMIAVKHPMSRGIPARRGIEY